MICSDKTGTLTLNRMTAHAGWFAGGRFSVEGDGYGTEGAILRDDPSDQIAPVHLGRPMALCNESRVRDGALIGDPTEGALWILARKAGLDPESEQARRLTGDHKLTAEAIGRELGLTGEVVTGAELDAMDEAALGQRIENIGVIARVSPAHKVRIVKALKARGHVVAMTGDGVNDAPAVKAADIGVAMGLTGTAVTREAATMVLMDDNFATIVRAVEEGRVIFDNIVKFVRFQLSTNIGAILTVLAATLMGLPTPFTAIQLLWINIIMDGPPAMTLGVEPARPGNMRALPRRQDSQILTLQRSALLGLYGTIMMVGTLWLFQDALTSHGQAYALTLAFTTFVLFQFFNVFNARSEHGSAFNTHFLANGKLWLALGAVLALQVLVVNWSTAQEFFGTVHLQPIDWLTATLIASSVLLLDDGRKWAQRRFEPRSLDRPPGP